MKAVWIVRSLAGLPLPAMRLILRAHTPHHRQAAMLGICPGLCQHKDAQIHPLWALTYLRYQHWHVQHCATLQGCLPLVALCRCQAWTLSWSLMLAGFLIALSGMGGWPGDPVREACLLACPVQEMAVSSTELNTKMTAWRVRVPYCLHFSLS